MHLVPRDQAILVFLDRTPATAAHILAVSSTLPDGPFRDERRVRERMQALARMKVLRSYSLAVSGGGLANYYRLTSEGYRMVHGAEVPLPHRSTFAELPPSRLMHTLALADVIVRAIVAAHATRVRVTNFHRENELVLEAGVHRVSPDCHMQFAASGRTFNVLVELDRSMEPVDSTASNSIRTKLLAYEAYQDYVWGIWKSGGERGQRPYFRVAFLTLGIERAHHILGLARDCAKNPDRRLCYATTLDEFLASDVPLHAPVFLDHDGRWQALINLHPSSPFSRAPVRIAPIVPRSLFV
jgi:hypothetical protein